MKRAIVGTEAADGRQSVKKYGRSGGGRHRTAAGTVRMVRDGDAGWLLAPAGRSTHYIGRVGALAVALGIGGALAGMPSAVADSGSDADATAASSAGPAAESSTSKGVATSGGRAETADATQAPRPTRRGVVRDRGSAAGGTDATEPARAEAGTRLNGRGSTSVAEAPAKSNGRDSVATAPPAAAATDGVPAPAAAAAATRLPAAAVSVASTPVEGAVDPGSAEPGPASDGPLIAETVSAAAAAAPVMTAAASRADIAEADPMEWLNGRGGTDVPAAAPLVWAAAAVSRRELAAPAPAVAPAASVSTGETVDPQTWLSDRIAGIDILAGLPEVIRTGIADAAANWVEQTFGSSALDGAAALVSVLEGGVSGAEVLAGVSDALTDWWDGADVSDRVTSLAASVVDDFLSAPGVSEALADAAEAVAGAASPAGALAGALGSLLESDAVRDAVGTTVSGVLGSLVSEADDVLGELGGTVSGWVADLTGSGALGATVADQLVALATSVLPDAAQIDSVADAAAQWWAEAEFSGWLDGLDGTAIGSVAADLLAAPGVSEVLAAVAGQVAGAADPVAALPAALRTALTSDAVREAVEATLSGALDSLLGDAAPVVRELGATLSGWVADLAGDSAVADWVGAVLPALLDQPGVAGVLAGVAGDFATAVLTGTDPGDAVTAAWRSLAADPDIRSAVDAAVSGALSSLLADAGLMQSAGTVISDVLSGILGDPDLAAWAGTVLPGFLGQPGVPGALADVAGDLATALLAGTGLSDAALQAWQALQADPDITAAVAAVMSTAVGGLLEDPDVLLYVRSAVSTVVAELVGDTGLAAQTADQLVPLVFSVLAGDTLDVDGFEEPITELLADWIVAADPGLADLAPAVAAAGFAVLRAGLLGDFTAVPSSIQDLATNAAVLASLADRITGTLSGLPVEVRAAVGEAATAWLAQSLGSATVAEALTAVLASITFPSGPAEVADYLNDLVGSGFDVQDALIGLFGPEVPAALGAFLADPDVLQTLGAATAQAVGTLASALLADVELPFPADLGDTVAALLSDVAGSALVSFLGQPGIGDALATGAVNAILTALGAESLPGGGSVPDTVNLVVSGAVLAVLSDPGLADALDGVAADLINALSGNQAVRALAGAQITALVSALVGDGSVAADLGPALSGAVLGLLADPAVADGLGAVTGALLSGLLGQPETVAAVAGIAGDVASALVSGADLSDAVQAAVGALSSDQTLLAVLGETVGVVLDTVETALLGDAAVQEAFGATAGLLLAELAENPTIRAVIDDQLGAALGPAFTGLLDEVIGVAGPLVTDLLGYPGISSALTGAADQIVGAVLAGADLPDALRDALSDLQANPAVLAAVDALIPQLLDLVATSDDLRDQIGETAKDVVTNLLVQVGLDNPTLNTALGQVTEVATTSLLANPAFGSLIGDIAADVLDGTAMEQVLDTIIDSVLRSPALQGALGSAVGDGIGALFGENLIGAVVGQLAGAAATFLIGLVAGFTLLFARPAAAAAEGLLDTPPPAFVVTLTLPDWQDVAVAV